MTQQEIIVRRARPRDAGKIAEFVNKAWQTPEKLDNMSVIERFGSVGFLLAEQDNELVGILGWMAENLVVGLTDLLVAPASERIAISTALCTAMEQAAIELQCEASLLFLPTRVPPALLAFCEQLGYGYEPVSGLSPMWQETARDGGMEGDDSVMIKRLREEVTVRPFNM